MILIIGYGNPLCGDDGIGLYVVEWLANEESRSDVEYLTVHQLTPELAEPISLADVVIVVDAAYGEPPGEIACQRVAAATLSETTPGVFTHNVNVPVLLESAQFLYNHRPITYLYTVTGENFGLGDTFSTAVESAIPRLLDDLKARINQCTNLVSLKG